MIRVKYNKLYKVKPLLLPHGKWFIHNVNA
jgi:hypothetical protein